MRELLRELPSLAGPLPGFDPAGAPDDPFALFTDWLRAAIEAGVREPHAMTLSTVDGEGRPSARVLILKDLTAEGFQFAFGSAGRKGKELANTPWAALTFYWAPLGRQVRVRGRAESTGGDLGARDFLARSETSRAVALLGRQSTPLADSAELETALAAARERVRQEPGLVAPDWSVGTVVPDEIEFWQGNEQRRHVRLNYRRTAGTWTKELLWP
ncbi:pyridoxal 5'-phosphate synthase [Amycolatopsis sp. YIM 10]|uniref:pyridoxine/pyridoxamine 5'-phosphate oxidase n=1 Tax=Amycolatopsis sp. YIM 10 TaxID=2653857 RepID=UPI0012903B29|nr:pyridoxal 5'-phosphate synthase [Amycolatopsis sp. YIM 10]QFU87917.1 Pyridoxine/pyridoxamine 5'-phosphate oxidase [Amycolatopsis sp. YIM 10]